MVELKNKIKLVIFDLDGTLVDAYRAITSSFNYVMCMLKYPLQDASVIRHAVGWGDKFLLKPFVKKKDLEVALRLYRKDHSKALLRLSRLYSGSAATLAYLKKKKYIIAVASNRPTRFSRILVEHLKIKPFLDYLLCADKLKHGKPHPEILNKIMDKFGFCPGEVVYVGDMVIDAQAGAAAGVHTIIVKGGSSSLAQIKKQNPDKIISKISCLIKIL